MNQSQVAHYENGNHLPSDKALEKIAVYFGVSLDYFWSLTDVSIESLDEDYKELRLKLSNPENRLVLKRIFRAFILDW